MDQRWRVDWAASAWPALPAEAVARWRAYAVSLDTGSAAVRTAPALRADNLFNKHYRKLLMLDRTAPPPLVPPERPFFGDALALRSDSPSPQTVRFVADRPSSEGVLVELLGQVLLSPHRRTYLDRYRHLAFVSFPAGDLEMEVESDPGPLGTAFRFVNARTGETTATAELGVLIVAA